MDFNKTIRYLAILAGLLIVVAYFTGATQLLAALFTQGGKFVEQVTGRNPTTGQFASYPKAA